MTFQEAKRLAEEWLGKLDVPEELKGSQVNTLAYLHDERDPVLLAAKKRALSRLLKKRGARIIHEADSWKAAEARLVVKSYFQVLAAKLRGEETNTKKLKEGLMALLNKSEKAVRFKLRHISSILVNSDEPYLDSFKPLPRANIDLVDWNETEGLKRLLQEFLVRDEFVAAMASSAISTFISKATTDLKRFVEPETPPESDCYDNPAQPTKTLRVAVRINYAEREAANRTLGSAGEEWVVHYERQRLESLGREDLALRVQWASREIGDGLGYDIASFNHDGSPRWIEVKTTRQGKYAAFYLTTGEIAFARENPEGFFLYRVFAFGEETGLFMINGQLEGQVRLTPLNFRAVFLSR